MLVDTHAHLEAVDNLDVALERSKKAGINKIITVGTSVKTTRKAIEISQKRSAPDLQIYATAGIHPQDGRDEIEKLGLQDCLKALKNIAKSSKKVVAIGECGFDYYLSSEKRLPTVNKNKDFQRNLFEGQIKLATDLKLPLIIHCRNAWDEIFNLIGNKRGRTSSGVFHSWTGNWDAAQKALDLGFYISFSGILTFKQSLRSSSLDKLGTADLKNAQDIQEVAKKASMNRILIETDSPFLSPEPFRGKTNEPKNVRITAQFLAKIRGLPFDKIAEATTKNAERLFGI